MSIFAENLWSVGLELSPWLLLGAAISGLIHIIFPNDFVRNQLTGRFAITKAVMLGIPLPLCSCGVIPAGLGLKKEGASDGASVGFLISTPQTGVDSILVASAFLGWPFALFKVAAAAIMGLLGGSLVEQFGGPPKSFQTDNKEQSADTANGFRSSLIHADDLIRTIWGWLLLGIIVSALITTLVPADSFSDMAAWGPIAVMLVMLLISLPLYVCATASVPIAASLVASGMPTGAALVFLMAGPATNVATIGAIFRAFGGRVLGIYLAAIVTGSVGLGMLYDAWIGTQVSQSVVMGDHDGVIAIASTVGLGLLFLRYAIQDAMRWLKTRSALQSKDSAIVIGVEGMTCGGCVSRLERTLNNAPGIDNATVTLDPGQAIVVGDVKPTAVAALIEEAGFKAVG